MNVSMLPKQQAGFSLIELMITLVLGLIITGSVVQLMSSNQVTERLNRAIASAQENGRFVITRLRADLLTTGRYDPLDPDLNTLVDPVEEAAFVQNRPVILPGDFAANAGVGSVQGIAGANDVLVTGAQGERDCRGYKLGYADNDEFYVVNEYFVEGSQLKCRGYDGRVLRGQKAAEGHNGHAAFTLLDDVTSFQVLYGVANSNVTGNSTGQPVRYVTADQLPQERANLGQVVAIRLAILVKGDGEVFIEPIPSFKLLNEGEIEAPDNGFYKQFETTVTLRNVKNFVRGRRV